MTPSNILLLSLDTTRADRLGCYGHWRQTSPHLDRFAERGVIFEQCLAPVIPTFPAHTTIFTGRDCFDHRIVGQHGGESAPACPETIPMLAERLTEAGYYTAAADNLGRWFQRGFQKYQGYSWDKDPTGAWRKGEAVNQAAFECLDDCLNQDQPWFLFCHYWDPHTPYLPPAPFDRMFYGGDETDPSHHSADHMWESYDALRDYFNSWMPGARDLQFPNAQYDAEIAYMDACLNHLWERLDDQGVLDDTMVIVTADHGEELDEHEMWYDHHGLYETNLHVPLILLHPDLDGDDSLSGMITHRDIVPTCLDAAGLPPDDLPGFSLLPLAEQGVETGTCDELYILENTWLRKYGWRTGEWKLIIDLEDPHHGTPPIELYNLLSDPRETDNLADDRPEIVAALRTRCEAHREQRVAETGLPDPQEGIQLAHRKIGDPKAAVPEDPRAKKG